ncbi:MAG: hypothetical protein F6K24_43290, partial [Okeania sp. SIO2D1]|nr:hypothetical protein [Okeania sp. SIO2D1]
MIAQPEYYQKMTPEEYLEWEATQEFRHEYVDGKILPMTRETIPYNNIVLNLCSTLSPSVYQKSCRINLHIQKESQLHYLVLNLLLLLKFYTKELTLKLILPSNNKHGAAY